ncbi:carbonic anhydrase [Atopostipes suicloacalis DSM 15692]|uniref:carbonic anhydrase n=1 Tax=Atopostipes suicloacalis DSM 15692 TaxID=1121025 RepID=A0A1M4VB77_9LACT|nr:carbonic anhydrase [Atopostipes suicloacalis]SHE66173.1 carbonic anhydrase [Atopostipes suicloacalis DSM 15692]
MNSTTKKGLSYFKKNTYKEHEELFHKLKDNQHPHTLFIACSDSRVSPELITDSLPGEIFTIRNIANTVPSLQQEPYDFTTLSSIEYAIQVLKVEQIIICAHSNCGGCAAALSTVESLIDLPYTKEYLKPLAGVREKVEEKQARKEQLSKATLMEQENAVEQLNHLYEYPEIRERVERGELTLEAWHYDIDSGTVLIYDEKSEEFHPPVD